MLWLFLSPTLFLLSVFATWLLIRYARAVDLLDTPVARSSHSVPVPVGGGLVFSLLFTIGVVFLFWQGSIEPASALALLGGILLVGVGLMDDRSGLSVGRRLIPQSLAIVWLIYWLGSVESIEIGSLVLNSRWLMIGITALGLLWLINLYNFMDGIDGLAASEAAYVNAMSLLLVINSTDAETFALSILLLLSVLGFLVWNWSPAAVFMGDAGSGFLGYALGALALLSISTGSITVWSWVIMLGVFLADATTTLGTRMLQRQQWWQGHASHAYQRLARRFSSHQKVTILVGVINVLWLSPWAIAANLMPSLGALIAAAALFPLVIGALALGAGTQNHAD